MLIVIVILIWLALPIWIAILDVNAFLQSRREATSQASRVDEAVLRTAWQINQLTDEGLTALRDEMLRHRRQP